LLINRRRDRGKLVISSGEKNEGNIKGIAIKQNSLKNHVRIPKDGNFDFAPFLEGRWRKNICWL
jgi:hypothetical protein